MPDSYRLPTDPAGVPDSLVERFNSGEVSAMMGLYEEGAVFVTESGREVTTVDGIRHELDGFLGLGLPMTVNVRHMFVSNDVALYLLDWALDGPGPDGEPLHVAGSATDVAHRGADGLWRYVIDNPYGAAVR